MPHRLWLRVQRIIPKLPEFSKRLAALEKQLKSIEKEMD
jgi:UDP-3-O-[3-hydroxymyristoyl] glucosamine N-acyltransferase